MDPLPEHERDRRLGAAIDGFFDALDRGEVVDVEGWAARFPDLAGELGESLDALMLLRGPRADRRSSSSPESTAIETAPPAALPGYHILSEIGRGGMGVVYKAWQISTKRIVALKLLAPGASLAARRRFEREIELAATLDHPGIVRVLAGGEAATSLYCAMEFVDGAPLHEHLARHDPPLAERLRLFADLAEAVHYAHLRAVVHRDLKPSNVMVDGRGQPRVLDFGLARFALGREKPAGDDLRVTREGQWVGTLPYLSPEQATSQRGDVDLRSDVYALGVILFEMLTGRLPYDVSGALHEALDRIATEAPPRPSRARREIGRDLDAVVLKALEKSREDRYQSAAELAEEVRRYQRGEPVEARRAGGFYLVRKAYARHRRGVQVAASIVALLVAASTIVLVLYVRLLRDEARLRDELHENRLRIAAEHLAAGHDLLAEGLLLEALRERADAHARWSLLCYAVQNPLVVALGNVGWTTAIDFSPDGSMLAHGSLEGRLIVRDVRRGFDVMLATDAEEGVRCLTFSPEGGWLAVGRASGAIELWSTTTWTRATTFDAHRGGTNGLRFLARGLLSFGEDGRVCLWDLEARRARTLWQAIAGEPVGVCDMTEDGRRTAVGSGTAVIVLDAQGREEARIQGFGSAVEALSFDRAGVRLATWSGAKVALWDAASLTQRWSAAAGLAEPRPAALWEFPPGSQGIPAKRHVLWIPRLVFSPDGDLLVSTGWDAIVRLWDVESGRALGDLRAHETAIYAAAFDPTSRRLATGCAGSARVWDLDHHPALLTRQLGVEVEHTRVAVSSAAGCVAWAGFRDGSACVAPLSGFGRLDGTTWSAHDALVQALAFDPRGELLATGAQDGSVSLWTVATLERRRTWSTGDRELRALCFSPDGTRLVTAGWDGALRLWLTSGELVSSWKAHAGRILSASIAADGARIASGGTDWWARVWRTDPRGATLEAEWRHGEWVNAVAFAPSGLLATAGAGLSIAIGQPPEGPRWIAPTHAHWITALCFLDRGEVLASSGYDGALRFFEVATGDELRQPALQGGPIESSAASADGRWLVLGTSRAVQLIDLGAAAELVARR